MGKEYIMKFFVYILKKVFFIFLFASFIIGCTESEKTLINKGTGNKKMIFYTLKSYKVPPSYTGVCQLVINGKKIEESTYKNGERDGKSFCWYEDTGDIMSKHDFKNGLLDGESIKYYNDYNGAILAKGIYKKNEPWSGSFLESLDGELDKSLIVKDQNISYLIKVFKEGKFIKSCPAPTP